MSAQQALALPSSAASNSVVINARYGLRIEADQRVIVVAGLPGAVAVVLYLVQPGGPGGRHSGRLSK